MAIPFVNSIISWFLKKRKHQMELFIKYPVDVQNELLFGLIQVAKIQNLGRNMIFHQSSPMKILLLEFLFNNTKV